MKRDQPIDAKTATYLQQQRRAQQIKTELALVDSEAAAYLNRLSHFRLMPIIRIRATRQRLLDEQKHLVTQMIGINPNTNPLAQVYLTASAPSYGIVTIAN